MASLVDLTQENEENDSDNGHHQPSPQELALQGQRQQHLIRIRIDMCPVAKPSIRFGPGRQARGRGQRSHPILYRRYVETDVMQQMEQLRNACITAAQTQGITIIPRDQPCIVKAWFFTKRPKDEFVSKRRDNGLREDAKTDENTIVPIKPDVDNYGKFLLDSLKGALYEDDAQVVSLHMYKCRDSEGECNGRMMIECSLLDEAARDEFFPNW